MIEREARHISRTLTSPPHLRLEKKAQSNVTMPDNSLRHQPCIVTRSFRAFLQMKTDKPANLSSTQKKSDALQQGVGFTYSAWFLQSINQKLAGVFALIISASSAPIFLNLCASVVGK